MPTAIFAQLCEEEIRTAPDLNLIGRTNWHCNSLQTSELCFEIELIQPTLPISNSIGIPARRLQGKRHPNSP